MVGEGLAELETKVSATDACFSTSESTHSRITNAPFMNIQLKTHCRLSQRFPPPDLESQSQQSKKSTDLIRQNDRLFTFMDEKEWERRQISKIILDQSTDGQKGNLQTTKRYAVQDGKNKPAQRSILKCRVGNKWIAPLFQFKIDKSLSKLSQMNRSKTPKVFLSPYHKNSTGEQRSLSKTPKFQKKPSLTPRRQNELRIIRAKSSLQKDFKRGLNVPVIEKYVLEQKQNEGEVKGPASARTLIKKKKQLERQLTAINESLLNCKKKGNVTTRVRPANPSKPLAKQSKRSTVKFSKLS